MIRNAEHSDIPRLMGMGQMFADKARLIEHIGYAPKDMEQTFAQLIDRDDCCLFMGENGAIAGIRSQHPFNYSHWIAQEIFWWSEGREGLRLLDALENWAKDGCHTLRMITLEAVNPVRMGRLYERRGYTAVEHSYLKVF